MAVDMITAVSSEGRAPRQGPVLEALAACVTHGDTATRTAAYSNLSLVCRTASHLFQFLDACDRLSVKDGKGWGRARRRAITQWYMRKPPLSLALAITKYRKRYNWDHAKVLRLTHIAVDKSHEKDWESPEDYHALLRYACKGFKALATDSETPVVKYLQAIETCRTCDAPTCASLVRKHHLCHEHLPSQMIVNKEVCDALLEHMPITALIRNLGKMTAIGVIAADNDTQARVCQRLLDADTLTRGRIHPYSLLLALWQYEKGGGLKSTKTWNPVESVSRALAQSFDMCVGIMNDDWEIVNVDEGVPPGSDRKILQAVDVSGSMAWTPVCGSEALSARVAAGALAYITAKRCPEDSVKTVCFGTEVIDIPALQEMTSLDSALAAMRSVNDGRMELVLMLDCTGSMGPFMEAAKNHLLAVADKLRCFFANSNGNTLSVGFVGYRDHMDRNRLVLVHPTHDVNAVQRCIAKQHASGGNDIPEDIAGALSAAKSMFTQSSEDAVKLILHIADAPCHGKKFHKLKADDYPDGDPHGIDPCVELRDLASQNVNYVFCDAFSGSINKKMLGIFAQHYNKFAQMPMGVVKLDHTGDNIDQAILQSVERAAAGGGTDCAACIQWAIDRALYIDSFILYTDNENLSGIHTILQKYREQVNQDARLAIVSLAANESKFVTKSDDDKVMEFVGFDTYTPAALAAFVSGRV